MTEQSHSQSPAERLISFLIASVTILAAVITTLQTYSAGKKAETDRLSSKYAIQAMQTRASGQVRVSDQRQGAYQIWYELDLQALGADLSGDSQAAARYRAARDQIAKLSPIFTSDYFDPASNLGPDLYKYEANEYLIDSTRLSEKFTAYQEIGNAWDTRANTFIVHLTLLAVVLSLYGLSTTLRGFMRGVFVVLGSSIAGMVILWAFIVMLLPIPSISEQAIESYANGAGKSWYGDYDGAIRDFDAALSIKPDYANAFYERGNAKFSNAYYNGIGDYQSALNDYEAALQAGRDDISVQWNLGWTYYLVGRFDEAVAIDRLILDRDLDLLGVRFNLALALMARGDLAEGEAEFRGAVDTATRQVKDAHAQNVQPPGSLWYYLDAAALDTEGLLRVVEGNPRQWSQSPSRESIHADAAQLQDLVSRMFILLKDTTTALEFTGAAPASPSSFSASAFKFATEELDAEGNLLRYNEAASFAYGLDSLAILFDFNNAVPGQSEIWKVYRNGVENPALRVVGSAELNGSGSAVKSIRFADNTFLIFSSGEYTVELYINSHLVQRGTFIVEEKQ